MCISSARLSLLSALLPPREAKRQTTRTLSPHAPSSSQFHSSTVPSFIARTSGRPLASSAHRKLVSRAPGSIAGPAGIGKTSRSPVRVEYTTTRSSRSAAATRPAPSVASSVEGP